LNLGRPSHCSSISEAGGAAQRILPDRERSERVGERRFDFDADVNDDEGDNGDQVRWKWQRL